MNPRGTAGAPRAPAAPRTDSRDSHVLHRQSRAPLPLAVAGDGPFLIDATGKRYLDASGGAAVSCLGHSHPAVRQAIVDQVGTLAFAHTGFFSNEPLEALADFLCARAPDGIGFMYPVAGGSEAMEAALKLARQYHLERGDRGRSLFIARRQSYHGNTLGALAVGGNAWRRAPFSELLMAVTHVTPCYALRYRQRGESDAAMVARLAAELDAAIVAAGPGRVAAFVAETVVGATAGAVTALPGYFAAVREVCDRHGVLLLLDEVMCGMGRTGSLFACDQEPVRPDIITIAKGLGAGYQPIGAVLLSNEIERTLREGSGLFQHGHTYIGHATACAAALAVQRTIEEQDLLARVQHLGSALVERLHARFGQHPNVAEIRGRGLFLGLELVAERAGLEPFPKASGIDLAIKRAAMERGLVCYPGGGTIDGERGHHVLLAPPFIIEESHLDLIVERLGDAIDAAVARTTIPA